MAEPERLSDVVLPGDDWKSQAEPLDHNHLLAFFNEFVFHISEHLNRFALVSEEKLFNLDMRLHHLEVSLALVEAKLCSALPSADTALTSSDQSETLPLHAGDDKSSAQMAPAESGGDADDQDCSDDLSQYGKFLKMLNVGVPQQAVRLKMQQEGVPDEIVARLLQ